MTAVLGFVALWWCLTGLDHGWPPLETWAPLATLLACVVRFEVECQRADRRDARTIARYARSRAALTKENPHAHQ